ncbi:2,3-epoxybenzoyl-CoA dihydrolase [Noviherbaspirillum galbum]|uniref:Benzoyl-CoA-dihydrodiol lyase n=1 Tax=Noviherbaspirillum galbum TaxID=2709383 RepID=A0A6B3SQ05_9BURK|nr:2,3-epoxybenzoyl-CoA dihydrolase [Noviherbaspirillum galbum]NEX60806.1 benzoyl-CoA-dihydrodiol lyase [Noviherbaspirillum galbum]
MTTAPIVNYETSPERYKHWSLAVDGPIATLTMTVNEEGGLKEGYKLKLNSYDLGVDIELHDAVQRIRFEHPTVKTVVITSGRDRIFCSGANIFMLGKSSHAWKVNFCKFTNETRNGLEDSSRTGGLKFVAAVNGACAGGGYELAAACDEIILVDDRSSSVSLPEVPLLGVLPGTGGLTRLTDKRHVRHDHADIFCTTSEGVRGQKAKDWKLVDEVAKPAQFADTVRQHALALADKSQRPNQAAGVKLTPLNRKLAGDTLEYEFVTVVIDRAARTATLTVKAPTAALPKDAAGIEAAGVNWWPLQFTRELDDAILHLRTNELDIGTWVLKSSGNPQAVLDADATLVANKEHWLVRETMGMLRRTLARLDVTSRSLFAFVEESSAFAGTFLEVALAADRIYMLALPDDAVKAPKIAVSELNFGTFPMVTGESRLARRFYGDEAAIAAVRECKGKPLDAAKAMELGLVTADPDDLDWADETRLALEERASMSPDALTGMEANLRFNGRETMETRIFGRLTAWQNWIFIRPNAVGEAGALKVYGSGNKAQFDMNRV